MEFEGTLHCDRLRQLPARTGAGGKSKARDGPSRRATDAQGRISVRSRRLPSDRACNDGGDIARPAAHAVTTTTTMQTGRLIRHVTRILSHVRGRQRPKRSGHKQQQPVGRSAGRPPPWQLAGSTISSISPRSTAPPPLHRPARLIPGDSTLTRKHTPWSALSRPTANLDGQPARCPPSDAPGLTLRVWPPSRIVALFRLGEPTRAPARADVASRALPRALARLLGRRRSDRSQRSRSAALAQPDLGRPVVPLVDRRRCRPPAATRGAVRRPAEARHLAQAGRLLHLVLAQHVPLGEPAHRPVRRERLRFGRACPPPPPFPSGPSVVCQANVCSSVRL